MFQETLRKKTAGNDAALDIRDHLPDEDRQAAAVIYYDGLQTKLAPVFGPAETALTVLSGGFQHSRGLTAYKGGQLVGLLGMQDARGGFLDPSCLNMIRHYGTVMGVARSLLLLMLMHTAPPGDLYLDGIAVARAHRSRGIGTALMAAFEAHARHRGFTTVSLEVIDTNPRARMLYRRLGYREVAVHTMGPFSRFYGFHTTSRMTKWVA